MRCGMARPHAGGANSARPRTAAAIAKQELDGPAHILGFGEGARPVTAIHAPVGAIDKHQPRNK